jgi:hypothetical protein
MPKFIKPLIFLVRDLLRKKRDLSRLRRVEWEIIPFTFTALDSPASSTSIRVSRLKRVLRWIINCRSNLRR